MSSNWQEAQIPVGNSPEEITTPVKADQNDRFFVVISGTWWMGTCEQVAA